MTDLINHPAHYTKSTVECIEFTAELTFAYGNVLKYLYRAGSKGTAKADLQKAKWYLDYFLEEMSIYPLRQPHIDRLMTLLETYMAEVHNPIFEQAVIYRCRLRAKDRKRLMAMLEIEIDGGKV